MRPTKKIANSKQTRTSVSQRIPIRARKVSGGDWVLTVRLTPKQLEQEALARKKRYCCSCAGHRTRKTIRASNSFSAGLKCLDLCGKPGFSLSKGACG